VPFSESAVLKLTEPQLATAMESWKLADLVGIIAPSSRDQMLDYRDIDDTGRPARNIELAEAAIMARLWKLAAARNTTGKVNMDAIQLIILAMSRFSSSVAMTVAGCAALEASGMLGVHDAAQTFVDTNGAALVVNQMRGNLSHAATQEYGTWILGSLGYLGFSQELEFLGGVEVVLMALKTHQDNAKVVRNGARALDGLSQTASESTLCDGRLEGLCDILRNHAQDGGAVKLVCGAIATIMRVSGDHAVSVSGCAEMAQECLSCMKHHAKDAEVTHSTLMMLGTMLWAKRAELGDLAPYQSSIGKAAEDAFMNHLTCVKVKQAVAWLQSLSCRGTQGLEIR